MQPNCSKHDRNRKIYIYIYNIQCEIQKKKDKFLPQGKEAYISPNSNGYYTKHTFQIPSTIVYEYVK